MPPTIAHVPRSPTLSSHRPKPIVPVTAPIVIAGCFAADSQPVNETSARTTSARFMTPRMYHTLRRAVAGTGLHLAVAIRVATQRGADTAIARAVAAGLRRNAHGVAARCTDIGAVGIVATDQTITIAIESDLTHFIANHAGPLQHVRPRIVLEYGALVLPVIGHAGAIARRRRYFDVELRPARSIPGPRISEIQRRCLTAE